MVLQPVPFINIFSSLVPCTRVIKTQVYPRTPTNESHRVLFGGWWVDRLGGYKGVRGVNVAAKSAAMFGLIATCAGVPAIFSRSFVWDIVFIWFGLFVIAFFF